MSRAALVVVPQHFGSLVFNRRTATYMPFDAECTRILLGMVRHGQAQPEWEAFCNFLAEAGFLRVDGRLDADWLDLEPPSDHLAGPLTVHLEVAAACNLTCKHCFAGPLPRRQRPLDLDEISGLFSTLAGMGCFRVSLTGGEPLLRKDLLAILDAAIALGLHPCLTTNALLLDEQMAKELGRRPLVWLNVSLEGATAEVNDHVRGAGTFPRVLEKIQLLREHASFTLAFTLTSKNIHQARECAELARQSGAMAAVFRPLYPVGVAKENLELLPTFADYAEALSSLEEDLQAVETFSPKSRAATRSTIYTGPGCGAANLVCSVSLGGQVNPCSFLGSEYEAGSLRERSFAEIWHESQAFLRLRGSLAEDFQGGCRARSQTLCGSVHARDPWEEEATRLSSTKPASNLERLQ